MKEAEGSRRQIAATNYYPAGTYAMASGKLNAVVDESLKVYGTKNVRVCDASVIPILHTVYALAEKRGGYSEKSFETESSSHVVLWKRWKSSSYYICLNIHFFLNI